MLNNSALCPPSLTPLVPSRCNAGHPEAALCSAFSSWSVFTSHKGYFPTWPCTHQAVGRQRCPGNWYSSLFLFLKLVLPATGIAASVSFLTTSSLAIASHSPLLLCKMEGEDTRCDVHGELHEDVHAFWDCVFHFPPLVLPESG